MCGFVGIIGVGHAAASLFLGLQAVQHRGQDAAGIGVLHQGVVAVHKDVGLVSAAIPSDVIASSPAGLTDHLQTEMKRFGKVIQDANIKAE